MITGRQQRVKHRCGHWRKGWETGWREARHEVEDGERELEDIREELDRVPGWEPETCVLCANWSNGSKKMFNMDVGAVEGQDGDQDDSEANGLLCGKHAYVDVKGEFQPEPEQDLSFMFGND